MHLFVHLFLDGRVPVRVVEVLHGGIPARLHLIHVVDEFLVEVLLGVPANFVQRDAACHHWDLERLPHLLLALVVQDTISCNDKRLPRLGAPVSHDLLHFHRALGFALVSILLGTALEGGVPHELLEANRQHVREAGTFSNGRGHCTEREVLPQLFYVVVRARPQQGDVAPVGRRITINHHGIGKRFHHFHCFLCPRRFRRPRRFHHFHCFRLLPHPCRQRQSRRRLLRRRLLRRRPLRRRLLRRRLLRRHPRHPRRCPFCRRLLLRHPRRFRRPRRCCRPFRRRWSP